MRIKSLELVNDPKIKNLKLDFTVDNVVQDTIIFAGNNGCGKTTILDNIYLLINYNMVINSERDIGQIKCNVIFNNNEIEIIKNNIINLEKKGVNENNCLSFLQKTNEFEYIIDFSKERNTYTRFKIFAIIEGEKKEIDSYSILHKGKLGQLMSTFYSTANINYNLNTVNAITTIDLDPDKNNIKTENNIGTDVKQTFVDIYNLDAQDFQKWASENIGSKIDESKMYVRINRFSNAFSYMFSNLKFDRIINSNDHKDVLFRNNMGDEIRIDDLSTGEKQIVIRGGYMLKYQKSIQSNFILIDEPELSLHPEWQKKILQFYKRLFTDENGNQTAQIFVATHSPFIVHNYSRYNDKVVVLNKDENDKITILKKPKYYSYDNNITVEKAFNIKNFSSSKNILFTEGETDKKYLDKAIELYFKGKVIFEVNWIGNYNQNGGAINTGCTGLNNLLKVLEANPSLFNNKIGLLYDCDTNKKAEKNELYFIYTLSSNDKNVYKIGIENQLILPKSFDYNNFIDKKVKIDDYGVESTISSLDKTKLCNYICSSDDVENILINLKKIIEDINSLFN